MFPVVIALPACEALESARAPRTGCAERNDYTMHIQCIQTGDELTGSAGLADAWNQLAADVPFQSWDWLEAWWRTYVEAADRPGHSAELATVAVRDDAGRLVGLAPWYFDSSSWHGRVLRFLGTHGVCSDYLGVLAAPGHEAEVANTLATWLTDEARGDWDLIELDSVDPENLAVCHLAAQMKSRGHLINLRPGPNCWQIPLPANWETYRAGLSQSHRKQVRRQERRLFATERAKLHSVNCEDDRLAGFEILVDLHQRRQISLGNHGSFASDSFRAFHQEVTRRFLRRGRLWLNWLELDGRPVAAEYGLAGTRTVYSYQGGFDPVASDESPGHLITLAMIQSAIEQGMTGFDFLRGDEPYKAHWRAIARPSVRLRIVAAHASARIRHGVWAAATALKDQLAGVARFSEA
jgi:CelD/BcsL family acetyltransferase involved in cellulose biosynthesis